MDARRVRGKPDPVAVTGHDITVAAHGQRSDPVDLDLQERVGPQMFGQSDRALPGAIRANRDMFRTDADGRGAMARGLEGTFRYEAGSRGTRASLDFAL